MIVLLLSLALQGPAAQAPAAGPAPAPPQAPSAPAAVAGSPQEPEFDLYDGFPLTDNDTARVWENYPGAATVADGLRRYLDDYEVNGDYGPFTFKEKKYKIDGNNLSVIALVQDETTRKVLQSTYLKVEPATSAR